MTEDIMINKVIERAKEMLKDEMQNNQDELFPSLSGRSRWSCLVWIIILVFCMAFWIIVFKSIL